MSSVSSMPERKLAIVIPAYKLTYLQETLQSIADQTCQSFRVYIGDDGSPHDIGLVVSSFASRLDIVYKRFDSNMGGTDLVAHWERCIDLAEHEEWVWLFSDDDTMDPTCVDLFYRHLPEYENIDLIHFNVQKIDGQSKPIELSKFPDFPDHYRVEDFCRDRVNDAQQSFVVEFIFRKSKFYEVGRFQKFDLAWGSDVATCVKLGYPGGIATIPGAKVYWRKSDQNISPNNSREMVSRKLTSVIDLLDFLANFAAQHKTHFAISPFGFYLRRWVTARGRLGLKRTFSDFIRLLNIGSIAKVPNK